MNLLASVAVILVTSTILLSSNVFATASQQKHQNPWERHSDTRTNVPYDGGKPDFTGSKEDEEVTRP